MRETSLIKFVQNMSSAGEAWIQYGIQDGRQTRKNTFICNFLITFICNFLVPLDSSRHAIKDCVPLHIKLISKKLYAFSTKTKLIYFMSLLVILCLHRSIFTCTCWVQNLRASKIIYQIQSDALFRVFNFLRIQDNAILTFLNTSNDLSTIELPPPPPYRHTESIHM